MRRLILLLFLLGSCLQAKEISITTWNLEWFPSGNSKGIASTEIESKRIADAAEVLRKLDSDIIVLQEVRDYEVCEALAKAIGPKYQVLVCSAFKSGFGGSRGLQQVAILSKYPAQSCWSEDWKTFGKVDPPRGFAFAHIQIDGKDIAVYGVHLKSNLIMGGDKFKTTQLNILKRELAAEQVLAHSSKLPKVLGQNFEAVIVAGDFNTNKDQMDFASEKTLQTFEDNGFTSGFENIPLSQRVTHPSKGRYPDATFDYIFVKTLSGARLKCNFNLLKTIASDHLPVTLTITPIF
jgi:endonuclease/exonuclease/phosphatase family metal-dependent hydrolase